MTADAREPRSRPTPGRAGRAAVRPPRRPLRVLGPAGRARRHRPADMAGRAGRPARCQRQRQVHACSSCSTASSGRPAARCGPWAGTWPPSPQGEDGFRFHREVGLVFQDPDIQLFSATVLDDVAFGPLQLGPEPGRGQASAATKPWRRWRSRTSPIEPHSSCPAARRSGPSIASVLSLRPEVAPARRADGLARSPHEVGPGRSDPAALGRAGER